MLELINRARMNPAQEGVLLDTLDTWYSREARTRKPSFFTNLRAEFASYPAAAPLAFHPKLIQAARAHSADMIARNFFDHVNPSGQDPTARGAAVGYDAGIGENLTGAGATNADEVMHNHFGLLVDYDNVDLNYPLGHRLNILSTAYTEAGMGLAGGYYGGRITQDFGGPPRAYIVGVAYNDANGNSAYDPGEGLAGVSVRPDTGNWYAVTSASPSPSTEPRGPASSPTTSRTGSNRSRLHRPKPSHSHGAAAASLLRGPLRCPSSVPFSGTTASPAPTAGITTAA
jgi:hypothetical protein